MSTKGILTLLAGYAAGLAIALKYRKDGSETDHSQTKKPWSPETSLLDEVVDMHRSAFGEAKEMFHSFFDDIQSVDDFKGKVSHIVEDFSSYAQRTLQKIESAGSEKKEELLSQTESLFSEKNKLLDMAAEKVKLFQQDPQGTLSSWIDEAKQTIESTYQNIKKRM